MSVPDIAYSGHHPASAQADSAAYVSLSLITGFTWKQPHVGQDSTLHSACVTQFDASYRVTYRVTLVPAIA
eukprot:3502466-Rhodomonas_salina.1